MKLSTRARYALRMMATIARQGDGSEVVNLNKVSRESLISRRYLEQLAIALRNASLLRGRRGKGGGYALAQPAHEIKLRDIVETAIGPINLVECVAHPETCERSGRCEYRQLYVLMNDRVTSVLDSFDLADLVRGGRLDTILAGLDGPSRRGGAPSCPCA